MWFALSLSLLVVTYNNLVNRWEPFHGAAYVPVNLAFAGAITALAATTLDLTATRLGLDGDLADAAAAFGAVLLYAIPLVALTRSRHAHRIADRRVLGLHGGGLVYYVLVRIPLGTALVEEVVFRGVLFGAWRDAGASTVRASLLASVAFGLWHISPTIIGIRINDREPSASKLLVGVAAAVVLTTIAGLGLMWLRLESSGVVAPIVIHAGINSASALAAVAAGRGKRADHLLPEGS